MVDNGCEDTGGPHGSGSVDTSIDTGHTYTATIQAVSPIRSRHIATMATGPEVADKRPRGGGSLKYRDASIQHGRHARKVVRQRSACTPRRVMNSPPPRPTPPLCDDIVPILSRRPSSHSPRPSSPSPSLRPPYCSPPPRRVSTMSTPLYIVTSPQDQQPKRAVTPSPGARTRPILVKMATITSPVMNRSVSPVSVSGVTRSADDSKCDYNSLDDAHGPTKDDLSAGDDVRDAVKLQKLFRKLQRQVHSPEHQVECLESLLQVAERRNRNICGRRSFAEPAAARHDLNDLYNKRRVTLGNIGRAETVANPEASHQAGHRQGQGSAGHKRRLSGGSSQFYVMTEHNSLSSFGPGLGSKFEFDDVSSPALERPTTLPEINSRPASRIMKTFNCQEEDIERQKRKTATAIVTSGALTFMILAAALVTASFLMSPVIEDVFVHSKMMNQSETLASTENTSFPTSTLYSFSLNLNQVTPKDELSTSVHQDQEVQDLLENNIVTT